MQSPIERVMQAFTMMAGLNHDDENSTRKKLQEFLQDKQGSDRELAIQGLRYLRETRTRLRHSGP